MSLISVRKNVDKSIAYLNDTIRYSLSVSNTGNVPADLVVITDPIPIGTTYVLGSLVANVPLSGTPETSLTLTNPILVGQTVSLSFQVKVTSVPLPNPIQNIATIDYEYTIDPQNPDSIKEVVVSNVAVTAVFKNNYSQQVSDLIHSVALEETALAAIANAEGAKIQKMVAMDGITSQELLCLNKSVADMMDSISTLENVLKQKLNVVSCQISGPDPCM